MNLVLGAHILMWTQIWRWKKKSGGHNEREGAREECFLDGFAVSGKEVTEFKICCAGHHFLLNS